MIAQKGLLLKEFAGVRQTEPSKESEAGPCLRQVFDQQTFAKSFGTLVAVRTVRGHTIGVAAGSLVGGIGEEDQSCNPSEGTCIGRPSAWRADRIVGGNTAVSLLEIPRNCHSLEKSHRI